MTGSNTPPKRTGLLIWLIVSQMLAGASLFFWLVMAGLSVMAFDSGVNQEAWNIVIAVWAYPIFPLGMVIGAWIAFAKQRNTLAAILSGLSFVPPGLLILAMWIQNMIWNFQQ